MCRSYRQQLKHGPPSHFRSTCGRAFKAGGVVLLILPRVTDFCSLSPALLSTGTFGEAFKAGGVVLKIVPMEGSVLVNGEPQKRADEILAEVSVTLTLSRLNGAAAAPGECLMLRRKVVELRGMAVYALHGAALLVRPRLHPAVLPMHRCKPSTPPCSAPLPPSNLLWPQTRPPPT